MMTITFKLVSMFATSIAVVPAWYLGLWCARFALQRQYFSSIVLLHFGFAGVAGSAFYALHLASNALFAAEVPWAGALVMASMSIVCVFVFGVYYGTKFSDPCCSHPRP